MKLKLPKLHNQILIALILGSIFGVLFNVNKNLLIFEFEKNKETFSNVVEDWREINFIVDDAEVYTFKSSQQQQIISKFDELKSQKKDFKLQVKNGKLNGTAKDEFLLSSVTSVSREKTLPAKIKWIGDIFIRLLNMIAVPLVLASLLVGAASLGDIKKFARIGTKTIVLYLVTTAFAITIGLVIANVIQPGTRMDKTTKENLLVSYQNEAAKKTSTKIEVGDENFIVDIVPKNPFAALSTANMLQIVFFALLLGMVLTMIDPTKAKPVISFFEGLSEAMIKLVDLVMMIAPIGVFALIGAVVSEFGFEILQTLIWYAVAVVLGLLIHTLGTYSSIVKFFVKMNPIDFFKSIRRAQIVAFSTSSSAATLPVTMECAEENLGVSKSISSFVLPLGATINMDGTALYQGVAAVFIAQVFGIDLTISQQLTIVLMATLASIGTAPVPGVGIIMLVIILKTVHIPEEGIALILGVDRILDMCRTVTNISGDAMVSAFVAKSEGDDLKLNLSNA